MYKEISRLIIYGDMDEDSILSRMADIFRKFDVEDTGKRNLQEKSIRRLKEFLKSRQIMDLIRTYGRIILHLYLSQQKTHSA